MTTARELQKRLDTARRLIAELQAEAEERYRAIDIMAPGTERVFQHGLSLGLRSSLSLLEAVDQ